MPRLPGIFTSIHRALLACSLVLLCMTLSPALCARDAAGVGIAAIQVADPVSGVGMPGFVFYPSTQATPRATAMGPYAVDAAFGAPASPGAKPLVVISHGHGGTNLGHHDLASYLARHGFVVATFEHPKDNFHDQSGTAKAAVLAGRAVQVRATISMLLTDPHWKSLIDPARIGVAGFSAGGYTSLLVVGAVPRFDRFIGYCHRHPKDAETCAPTKTLSASELVDDLAALQKDLHKWGPTADPRVRSAFVMAPLSLVFDKAGAAAIDRPVDLWYGQNDHVLLPAENAAHIAPLISMLTRVTVVPKADHWVFLAPCSPALAREAKTICSDPPGVDRVKVHAQLNADALAFFRQTLAAPTP